MSSPAVTFDAPLKQATTVPVPVPAGVTFDAPVSTATSVPVQDQSQAPQSSTPSSPQAQPSNHDQWGPQWASDASSAILNTVEGAGKGLLSTVSGTDDWARQHLPAALTQNPLTGKPADLQHVHEMATPQGAAQNTGYGLESLAEFVLGDEALKALPISQRLLKASKIMQTVEESPALSRLLNLTVRGARGAAVGSTQGALKSGGDASDTAGAGIAGGVGNALVPEAFDLVKSVPGIAGTISEAVRGAERVVQPELQGSLRQILGEVAAENGVTVPKDIAVRDLADHVGNQLKSKGSALYKDIDNSLGGTRFQTFDEQISNVRKALRNDTGVDHDLTGRLIERLNDLEDSKAAAIKTAIEKGIDPRDFQQANQYWRQGSALQDFGLRLRRATSGLPDNLKDGSNAANAAKGEIVSPNKLSPSIHSLRDSGRLSQAVGPQRADELLRQVESARARTADIAGNRKTLKKVVTSGAAAAGAAGMGYGAYEVSRHAMQ